MTEFLDDRYTLLSRMKVINILLFQLYQTIDARLRNPDEGQLQNKEPQPVNFTLPLYTKRNIRQIYELIERFNGSSYTTM